MSLAITARARRAGVPVAAAAALALAAAPAALADGMSGMPGMSAEEHAQMSATPGAGGHDHGSMPGMSAEEHAQMSATPGAGGHDHGSMPGMSAEEHAHMSPTPGAGGGHQHGSMDEHGAAAADTGRPAGLVLGGFALVNALVLAYAAVVRRRPDALKRRRTLARVRSAPPERTVFPPSSTSLPQR